MQISSGAKPIRQTKRKGAAMLAVAALALTSSYFAAVAVSQFRAISDATSLDSASAVTIGAARSFDDAINTYMRTGDEQQVRATLSDSFVDHLPAPGFAANEDGFMQWLAALRATAPGIQFQAAVVRTEGDLVTLQVTADAGPGGQFPASPGELAQRTWTYTERLRVRNGAVTERWGAAAPFAVTISTAGWRNTKPGDGSRLAVAALSVSETHVLPPGETLWLVESGRVDFHATGVVSLVPAGTHERGLPPLAKTVSAGSGDLVYAEHGVVIEPREPSRLLEISVQGPRLPDMNTAAAGPVIASPVISQGPVSIEDLSERTLLYQSGDLPEGPLLAVTRTRQILPAGSMTPQTAAGSVLLLTVTQGEVAIGPDGRQLTDGQSIVLPPGLDQPRVVTLAPTAIEIVSIELGPQG